MRVTLPRQNPSHLEVLALPGLRPRANEICEPFSTGLIPRSSYKACVGVIVPRIRKSSIPWRVQTMTLKSRADV